MSKQIPELTIVPTPTAGQESIIETVIARHDNASTFRMTLAQIFTFATVSGGIKTALDALSTLIATNTTSITNLSNTKLDKVGMLRTGLTANRAVITDASGNETYLTGTTSQTIGFDGAGKPIAITPTVDIHGLSQKTAVKDVDEIIISDSEASYGNKRALLSDLKKYTTPLFYGDGSDGDVTISSTVTLVRDMYYNNLTLNTGAIFSSATFKVFVKGTLTVNNGTWSSNGTNGSGTTAGTGGPGGNNGGAGGAGQSASTGSNGTSSTSITNTLITINDGSGNGASGGAFTTYGPGTPGSAGSNTVFARLNTTYQDQINTKLYFASTTVWDVNPTSAGAGGSGAGGNSGNSGGSGGGGGGSGGKIVIIAKTIIINGGTIALNGGNGAAGGFAGSASGGGGGGGGSGGALVIICDTITRSGGTISLVGGNGGNGGNANNQGGSGGRGGMGGRIYLFAFVSSSIGSPTLTGGTKGTGGTGSINGAGADGVDGSVGSVITGT